MNDNCHEIYPCSADPIGLYVAGRHPNRIVRARQFFPATEYAPRKVKPPTYLDASSHNEQIFNDSTVPHNAFESCSCHNDGTSWMTSRGQGAPALAPPLSFRVFKPKGIRKTSVPPPIQNIHSSSMDGTHPFTYSANVAHPYTPAGTVFNFPVPPALHGISCMPPPIRRREEREPRVYSYQSKKTRKKCAEMPSSSRRRPHGRKAAKRPFSCDTCGKRFAQRQGLNRHDRAKHNPSLCIFCDVKWSRPYQYRDHLEAHHPDVDPDTIVGKTAGSRRRAASLARCAPQQQVSPPTTEIGSYPPMPLQPVVVKPPTAAPHAMSFMTYIPQPASAQPTMTKSNPKGAVNLNRLILLVLITRFRAWKSMPKRRLGELCFVCGQLPGVDMLAAHLTLKRHLTPDAPCRLMDIMAVLIRHSFRSPLLALMRSGGMRRHLPTQGWAGREYHIRHIDCAWTALAGRHPV